MQLIQLPLESASRSPKPQTFFPPLSPRTAPAPRGGGGGGRRPGGVGLQVATYEVWRQGRGMPPPRQPLPQWRYPHGPLHGEVSERTVHGFPPAIPTRYPHSLRKEGAEGRVGCNGQHIREFEKTKGLRAGARAPENDISVGTEFEHRRCEVRCSLEIRAKCN